MGHQMSKMIALYNKYKELLAYCFWGGLTTLINYMIYFGCTKLAGMDYLISNVAAWSVAILFAFIVNKVYVFCADSWDLKSIIYEFGSFTSARVLSGAMETGLLWLFVKECGFRDTVIKIMSGVLVIIINYFFSKMIIFRKRGRKKDESCF